MTNNTILYQIIFKGHQKVSFQTSPSRHLTDRINHIDDRDLHN